MGEAFISRRGGGVGDCKVLQPTDAAGTSTIEFPQSVYIDPSKYDYIFCLSVTGDTSGQDIYVIKNGVIVESKYGNNHQATNDNRVVNINIFNGNRVVAAARYAGTSIRNNLSTIIQVKKGTLADKVIEAIVK